MRFRFHDPDLNSRQNKRKKFIQSNLIQFKKKLQSSWLQVHVEASHLQQVHLNRLNLLNLVLQAVLLHLQHCTKKYIEQVI